MALPIAPHRCQCRCSWRRRLSAADVSFSLSLSLSLFVFQSASFFIFLWRARTARSGAQHGTVRSGWSSPLVAGERASSSHWRSTGAAHTSTPDRKPPHSVSTETGFFSPVFPHLWTSSTNSRNGRPDRCRVPSQVLTCQKNSQRLRFRLGKSNRSKVESERVRCDEAGTRASPRVARDRARPATNTGNGTRQRYRTPCCDSTWCYRVSRSINFTTPATILPSRSSSSFRLAFIPDLSSSLPGPRTRVILRAENLLSADAMLATGVLRRFLSSPWPMYLHDGKIVSSLRYARSRRFRATRIAS